MFPQLIGIVVYNVVQNFGIDIAEYYLDKVHLSSAFR